MTHRNGQKRKDDGWTPFENVVSKDIFKAEDEIIEKRDKLIESLERRLAQRTETSTLFTIRWTVE